MSSRFDMQAVRGNSASAVEKLKREVNRLQLRQIDQTALEMQITWDDEVIASINQNRNTGSSYNAQIMELFVRLPMRITRILWSVRTSGTYQLRHLWAPNIASSFATIGTTANATGLDGKSGLFFEFDDPLVLLPGTHYLGLYITPAVLWWDYNGAAVALDGAWATNRTFYNTSDLAYTVPVELTYRVGRWS